MHYFGSPAAHCSTSTHPHFPACYWLQLLTGLDFSTYECSVIPEDKILSTCSTVVWMNMNDHDEIWRRSESLIKGGQPVTCGNVSQWISGCPGLGFLLLCYWWLNVPDLSFCSLSSSHKWTHILFPNMHTLKVTVYSCLLLLYCLPLI